MSKTIKIRGSTHGCSYEVVGRPLLWCQTVEMFAGKPFQVPAVIVETEAGIRIVPLRREAHQIEIGYADAA